MLSLDVSSIIRKTDSEIWCGTFSRSGHPFFISVFIYLSTGKAIHFHFSNFQLQSASSYPAQNKNFVCYSLIKSSRWKILIYGHKWMLKINIKSLNSVWSLFAIFQENKTRKVINFISCHCGPCKHCFDNHHKHVNCQQFLTLPKRNGFQEVTAS